MVIDSVRFQSLAPRLAKILPSLAEGHSNPEIACEMSLAVHTVEVYISEIAEVLQCHNRAEIAVCAAGYLSAVPLAPGTRSWSI